MLRRALLAERRGTGSAGGATLLGGARAALFATAWRSVRPFAAAAAGGGGGGGGGATASPAASSASMTAAERKALIHQYRRATKMASLVKTAQASPLADPNKKIARHPLRRLVTVVLTNGSVCVCAAAARRCSD